MTDFYSQNRCVCSTRSHGPLLCAFCLSFHYELLRYELLYYNFYDASCDGIAIVKSSAIVTPSI